jgi:RNA polymerase sigma factor (sigma-70 family)
MKNTEHYLPLVTKLAGERAKKSNRDFDDLYQEGCIALIKSIAAWDPNAGVKPITYLSHRIYWAMFDYAYPNRKNGREDMELISDVVESVEDTDYEQVDHADELAFLQGRLDPRRQEILRLRCQDLNFQEIGARMGFSKQRAKQLYDDAIATMQGAAH